MTAPRIRAIKPLTGRRLLVVFVNGVRKIYDCHNIMKLERFHPLRDEVFFKTVTLDAGGYGVSWNDEVDLSEYELWHNGVIEEDQQENLAAEAEISRPALVLSFQPQ